MIKSLLEWTTSRYYNNCKLNCMTWIFTAEFSVQSVQFWCLILIAQVTACRSIILVNVRSYLAGQLRRYLRCEIPVHRCVCLLPSILFISLWLNNLDGIKVLACEVEAQTPCQDFDCSLHFVFRVWERMKSVPGRF